MPARYSTWRADRIRFAVTGRGAQALFGQAAQQGIPLRRVHCAGGGYAASAQGRDLERLQALAQRGGWQLEVIGRRGAGPWAERLLHRPGVPLGLALCAVLLRLFSAFVWAMDFSGLDAAQQQTLRALLDQNGIREGSCLTQAQLLQAQQALSLHSEEYGWLSLNFAGGCLFVETAGREQQSIRSGPAGTALYAKAGGEVLSVEVDSGFAAVTPGQYVAPGQLLAAAVRADHSGGPVNQAASGRILARVAWEVTAAQPLRQQATVLTGRHTGERTLCLLGRQWTLEQADETAPDAEETVTWQPLRLGRIALPASIRQAERWEQRRLTLVYSEETAAALARRACRLRLAEQFPDAVVETQALQTKTDGGQVVCTARYVFTADIAQAEPDRGEYAP